MDSLGLAGASQRRLLLAEIMSMEKRCKGQALSGFAGSQSTKDAGTKTEKIGRDMAVEEFGFASDGTVLRIS